MSLAMKSVHSNLRVTAAPSPFNLSLAAAALARWAAEHRKTRRFGAASALIHPHS